MNPIHRLPKLEKTLLLTAFTAALSAVVLISAKVANFPISQFGKAQIPIQIVRSWKFDTYKENWKGHNIREAVVKNGSLNVRIGQQINNPLIFNRQALTKFTLPGKKLTINLAIQKNTNNPPPLISPATAEVVTNVDLQIINLPQITPTPGISGIACTADVLTCPDGSFVGRTPPSCSFICPDPGYPTFLFNVYYKNLATSAWSQPIPVTGKISPDFQNYYVKLPDSMPLTIEALKIEFTKGVTQGDIIQIDQIDLTQENQTIPTISAATPTGALCLQVITPARNKLTGQCQLFPTSCLPDGWYKDTTCVPPATPVPSRFPCVTPPQCNYGITDSSGTTVYCLPKFVGQWCPKPTPTCTPRPDCLDAAIPCLLVMPPGGFNFCPKTSPSPTRTPYPSCVPYPDNCITWQNGKAIMTCQFIRAENWCPLPTCSPRPKCMDAMPPDPVCLLPETPNMCPKTYSVPTYDPYPSVGLLNPQTQNNQTCFYNGKAYNEGDSVPSGDSCNSCGCSQGQVNCTLMACP